MDNRREFDPSILTANPNQGEASGSGTTKFDEEQTERAADIATDPFASYFNSIEDPTLPPKVLITTSPKASKATYEFCDELVGVFPGAEFRQRKKGKGFEMGRIAGWSADRGYKHLIVVNEDMKKPSKYRLLVLKLCLNSPVRCHHTCTPSRRSYGLLQAHLDRTHKTNLRASSMFTLECHIDISKGHARATPHHPELVLNGFVTRLGHACGRMFQTAFPQLPEFQGRQVVTLHNQRDFIFFRRHR